MNKTTLYIGGGVIITLAVLLAAWYLFFSGSPTTPATTNGPAFGQSDTRTNVSVGPEPTGNNQVTKTSTDTSQKIFKISDGPVAGATLLESSRPTTTVARFVMADSGHIFDLTLDSPGAVATPVSNTTIPGIAKVSWSEAGRGALVQYLDAATIKTAHFGLPGVASSSTAVKIQFLQNNITSLAVSPDGANVAFLIKTSAGADGYTARADGGGIKKLFSLPLSQLSLSWPSAATLLAVSAPAASVSGGAFVIDAKSGAASPLLFAEGLSVVADKLFSRLIYQTAGAQKATYLLDTKTGIATPLSFDPLPEQCIFSNVSNTTMFCAAPMQYVTPDYIDQRHQGLSSAREALFSFNLLTSRTTLLANPGTDGGEPSEIAELSLSPHDTYALFIRRGDRSLWGVRLGK